LREREDAAAIGLAPTPPGSEASAVPATEVVAGDGSDWRRDTATTVARGANIWVRALRKPSPQVELADAVEPLPRNSFSPHADGGRRLPRAALLLPRAAAGRQAWHNTCTGGSA
jgi:hypothetical protein